MSSNTIVIIIIAIVVIGGGLYFLMKFMPAKKPKIETSAEAGDETAPGEAPTEEVVDKKAQKREKVDKSTIPNTGAVAKATDGSFVVNPKSTFPLSLYNIDEKTAKEIKKLLEEIYVKSLTDVSKRLKEVVQKNDVKCRQIDEYINAFKPHYQRKAENIKTDTASWSGATAGGMGNILATFKDKAVESLAIQPSSCNLPVLFDGHTMTASTKDVVGDKYGPEISAFYKSKKKGIHIIPPSSPERKAFEALAGANLAVAGSRVNPKLVIETMEVVDMSRCVADLNYPEFKDKANAIKTLSDLPDLRQRLNRVVKYNDYFEIIVPKEIDKQGKTEETKKDDYALEFSKLLCTTYFRAGNALADKETYNSRSYSFIKTFELSADKECCPYCKKQAGKEFARKDYPNVPLHLGCRCSVISGT